MALMEVREPAAADPAVTLARVEARMERLTAELADAWRAAGATRSDILGDDDLPQLLAAAARGGKRIRPAMVHWGWVAAGAPAECADALADLGAAVELLHVFALVHDDVMDRSELRRGHPTVHALARDAHRAQGGHDDPRVFGDSIAILAGDLLHAEVLQLVAAQPDPVRALWRQMMIELVLGQKRDLTGAAAGRRDLEHSLEVARLKSGSYTVEGPLLMGAALAGADAPALGCLRRYADHVGRAFGLRDDLLGVWGDPRTTGKSADDDLAEGKATVLLALASDRLSDEGRARLAVTGTGGVTDADVEALREEMAACGIRDEVERMIADEVAAAVAALDPALVSAEGIAGLAALADRIAWRQA